MSLEEEEADLLTNVLNDIDDMMGDTTAADYHETKMCQMIKDEFKADSFTDLFTSFHGIQKEVGLMVLQQAVPRLSKVLNKISKLPLDKFQDRRTISNYLGAVIKSGVAANFDYGIVFLVGNTGVGKSSLANTLKAYLEQPSDNPSPILAGEGKHKDLIETQVLQVYPEVPFHRDDKLSIKVTSKEGEPDLVDFVEESNSDSQTTIEDKQSMKIRIVDMGGHQEYYASSSLFFSTSGLFLVCFKSSLLERLDDLGDEYYGHLGTFVDLVSQTSTRPGMKLKIALVGMQGDSSQGSLESRAKLLEITKNHLCREIKKNNLNDISAKLFLVNEVFMTSSKVVFREVLEKLQKKVALLCSDNRLKMASNEIRPFSWHKFLDRITQFPQMTLEGAKFWWEQEEESGEVPQNITPEETETLESFLKVISMMIENEEEEKKAAVMHAIEKSPEDSMQKLNITDDKNRDKKEERVDFTC